MLLASLCFLLILNDFPKETVVATLPLVEAKAILYLLNSVGILKCTDVRGTLNIPALMATFTHEGGSNKGASMVLHSTHSHSAHLKEKTIDSGSGRICKGLYSYITTWTDN